ncbi:MAG: DUF935 family protein [Campylobacterales bacterium]|nr:DUF935 family protein [Campylobacterales bacterium]
MKKGIYISPSEFVEFDSSKLAGEIATRSAGFSDGWWLPNPDPVLRKMGKNITAYKDLKGDSRVSACILSRKAGVKKMLYSLDRGSAKSKRADFIEEIFATLDIEQIISEILDAPLFGFKPLEVVWEKRGGYVVPAKVVGKPPEWFAFDNENNLLYKNNNSLSGERVPEYKFLLAQNDADYENPYGTAALSSCFWAVAFKKGGLKFWVSFTEKYGSPFIVGKYARGTNTRDIDALLRNLENMIQDAVAVIPDDARVEIIEAAGKSASADIYKELVHFCNSEIATALVGQTGTTEIGGGTYGAVKVHEEVKEDIVLADSKLVSNIFNELITWIVQINFGDNDKPKFSMYKEEDVDQELADRDKKLADTGQVKFTKTYFVRNYGFAEDEIIVEGDTTQKQSSEFAEAQIDIHPSSRIDMAAETIMDDASQMQRESEELLKPILKIVSKSASYEEVIEAVFTEYPNKDSKTLEEHISRAIFISELWGRVSAEDTARD